MTGPTLSPRIHAVQWKEPHCVLLDQSRLPGEEIYEDLTDFREVVTRIKRLQVRGAPAIGIAGAYAVVLAVKEAIALKPNERKTFLKKALEQIAQARPTAVNLGWAVRRIQTALDDNAPIDQKT